MDARTTLNPRLGSDTPKPASTFLEITSKNISESFTAHASQFLGKAQSSRVTHSSRMLVSRLIIASLARFVAVNIKSLLQNWSMYMIFSSVVTGLTKE